MAQENTVPPASAREPGIQPELSRARTEPWLRGAARRLVLGRLVGIEIGRLELVENGSTLALGRASEGFTVTGRVEILDGAFWERLAWGGSIGAAEAYCDGFWTTPDLTSVVRVLARNQEALADLESGTASVTAPLRRLLHRARTNTRAGSIRNIAAHYDTGDEFFAQFLDPTLTYSCAIFPDVNSSLETAQEWKLDTVCRKLELRPTDHLIEIGTGWGGLAIHAARRYGCRVTTATISRRQFQHASRAVAAAGLEDRVTVLLEDYRNLPQRLGRRYDKLVSIEMIEAVGHAFLPRYCEVLGELLVPDGLALVQAILIPDQQYDRYRRDVDFIQHYIFPGSLLPSMARIQECTMKQTDLRLVDLEDLTPHYAKTLDAWRRRFEANEDRIAGLGLSEAERRKWKFYFSYCEGGFLERSVGVAQLLLARPENRRPAGPASAFGKRWLP